MSEQNAPQDLYGPLFPLIGVWEGDKGMDVSPEKQGEEMSPYFETIRIEALGNAKNAGEQSLAVLGYTQIVHRKSTGEVFHHQTGYWYFEKKANEILYSLTIPRAVTVLSRGHASTSGGKTVIDVSADANDDNYGILESAFMSSKASTRAFKMKLTVEGGSLTYSMNTALHIYGRDFSHTDENSLTRKP